jgi:hypothetical protein
MTRSVPPALRAPGYPIGTIPRVDPDPGTHDPVDLRPSRWAFIAGFVAVVVAGLSGAAIGAGLGDLLCVGSCGGVVAGSAAAGALAGAGGVAVVAVLVLRAMTEWNRHRAKVETAEEPPGPDPAPGPRS